MRRPKAAGSLSKRSITFNMKRIALVVTACVALQLRAQTVVTAPSPAISPSSVTPIITVSDVAGSHAITGTASSPILPVADVAGSLALNRLGPTNQVNQNVSVGNVAPLLVNVESNLLETLPLLAAFNDNFNFVNVSSGTQAPGATPTSTSVTVSTQPTMLPNSTNILGLPPGLTGLGTTNGARTIVLTRETLRALVVLENDIERMLPILDAVNGGTNFIVVVTNK